MRNSDDDENESKSVSKAKKSSKSKKTPTKSHEDDNFSDGEEEFSLLDIGLSNKKKRSSGKASKYVDDQGNNVVRVSKINYRAYKEKWIGDQFVNDVKKFGEFMVLRESEVCSLYRTHGNSTTLSDYIASFETSPFIPPLRVVGSDGINEMIAPLTAAMIDPTVVLPAVVDIATNQAKLDCRRLNKKKPYVKYDTIAGGECDILINAGGPIWSTQFAPDQGVTEMRGDGGDRVESFDKYLAVGLSQFGWPTHRNTPGGPDTVDGGFGVGSDYIRTMGVVETNDNILQIWQVSGAVQHGEGVDEFVRGNRKTYPNFPDMVVSAVSPTTRPTPEKSGRPLGRPRKPRTKAQLEKEAQPKKPKGRPRKTPLEDVATGDADADETAPNHKSGGDEVENGKTEQQSASVPMEVSALSRDSSDGSDEEEPMGQTTKQTTPVSKHAAARESPVQASTMSLEKTHFKNGKPRKGFEHLGHLTVVDKTPKKIMSAAAVREPAVIADTLATVESTAAGSCSQPEQQQHRLLEQVSKHVSALAADQAPMEVEEDSAEEGGDLEGESDGSAGETKTMRRVIIPESTPYVCPPVQAELAYCVSLEHRGPTWSVTWCPMLFDRGSNPDLLGVLAVVCGDGSCLVLVLPRSSQSPHSVNDVPVYSEGTVCRCVIRMEGSLVTSAAWSAHYPGELLCGMSDGSIGSWRLEEHLFDDAVNARVSYPVELSMPHLLFSDADTDQSIVGFSAVRCLQVCPYQPDFILSGSCDGSVRIWSTFDRYVPVYRRSGLTSVTDVRWDPMGHGFYFTTTDTTVPVWDFIWTKALIEARTNRVGLYSHVCKLAGLFQATVFDCDEESFILTVSSDGSVRGGFASQLIQMKSTPTEALLELFRVLDVTSDEEGVGTVTVSRERFNFANAYGQEAMASKNSLSVHTVHSTRVYRGNDNDLYKTGSQHLVACGGAAGLLRIRGINPCKLLMHNASNY